MIRTYLHIHRQNVSEKVTILSCYHQSLPICGEFEFCYFTAPDWQIKSLLLYLLPVTQPNDFYLVLPSHCEFIEDVIDG